MLLNVCAVGISLICSHSDREISCEQSGTLISAKECNSNISSESEYGFADQAESPLEEPVHWRILNR